VRTCAAAASSAVRARREARRGVLPVYLSCAALLACERPAEHGDADLARMIDQPRADAFDASAFFADSAVLRVPPAGTVPFDRSPLGAPTRAAGGRVPPADTTASPAAGAVSDTAGVPTPAIAAGDTADLPVAGVASETGGVPTPAIAAPDTAGLPVALTTRLLARGRDRFGIYCAVCHGTNADGNSIVGANMHDPSPPSLVTGPHASHGPAHLYDVITNGVGRMPSYAAELDPEDRWAVVAWVLGLRGR
jgi:mono/diheme cytochrome c family protein